jgi:hypothetical protein
MPSRLIFQLFISLSALSVSAQLSCLPNSHSHNDYRQKHPLLDALNYRFASVEADVFLIRGELYVSHTYPFRGRQRLDSLYLEPLQKIINARGGKIYENASLILLIDIKSDAAKTYAALEKLLEKYKPLLTSYENGKIIPGAVTIILSGNKPYKTLEKETSRCAFIDQALLAMKVPSAENVFLMASTKYSSVLSWKGKGPLSEAQKKKLEQLTATAHQQGRKVRLWAAPENEIVWKTLLDCGVDLITTDKLEKLSLFLGK